jgi:hypothetical protein
MEVSNFYVNGFSKLTLFSITNEFLNAFYIQLVIFLSISFKYYIFYYLLIQFFFSF